MLQTVAAIVVASAQALALPMPSVRGEPALAPKVAPVAPRLHIASRTSGKILRLSPISDREIAPVRQANARHEKRRVVIGAARAVQGQGVARNLDWVAADGGYAARLSITSPDAGGLRLAIDLEGVPLDVEMVFFGSDYPDRLIGPVRVGSIAERSQPWWSPLTEGETQTVEFFVPRRFDTRTMTAQVVQVSHLLVTPSSRFTKRTQDIGAAASCNVDIKCSSLQSSAGFLDVRNSVAEMVLTDGGFTILCSGTLLNDTDGATQVPWFYSANHCLDNESAPYKTPSQMQAVASTLNTLWFFEAVACNDRSAPPYVQLSNGAAYLYSNVSTDVLFLRLNDAAPAGTFFAGWDANAISAGVFVVAIQHPEGDLKKVATGSVTGFTMPGVGGGSNPFIGARWSQGTTEPGSSGGGLFTSDGSQYALRGGLWGGGASCTNTGGVDNFSRFDQAYPSLATYLSATATPFANFTDLWWNPSGSGWGLNLFQHPDNVIFAVWYTYDTDGKRMWLVMPSGSWTSSNQYSGPLYRTAGPPFTDTFDPTKVVRSAVGTGTLTFADANNGTWAFTVDGNSGSKAITRQSF